MNERHTPVQYERGLDGLRAVGVLPVLLFHLSFPWATGALFGVSLFFTISGYLITQILLREVASTGRVDLIRFWTRRARRLWPAVAVCLVLVAALSLTASAFSNSSTRGDIIAAVFNVSNWRLITTNASYDDIFLAAPSPLVHFWSLAIEEQFYLIFPIVAAMCARRRSGVFQAIVIGLGLLSLMANALTTSHTLIYYGTHTRAFELLAGAALAFVCPLGRAMPVSVARLSRLLAVPAFAGFILLVSTTNSTDAWLYSGGLQVVTLLSCFLVLCVVLPTPLRSLASTAPMVWIGKMSYGLYVFHWPIFRVLTNERLHLDGVALAGVRLVATASIAVLCHRLVESPIRLRDRFVSGRSGLVAYSTTAALLSVVALLATGIEPTQPALAGLGMTNAPVLFETSQTSTADPTNSVVPTTHPVPPLRVLLLGNQPDLKHILQAASSDRRPPEIVDLINPQCPILGIGDTELRSQCINLEVRLRDRHEYDLVVVGSGELDRKALPPYDESDLDTLSQVIAMIEPAVDLLHRAIVGGTPVVIVDRIPDRVATRLSDLESTNPKVSLITDLDPANALRNTLQLIDRSDALLKVLVIGDSTSFGMASALSRAAAGRAQVMWGGGQNCPLVPVIDLKWYDGAQWNLERCPTATRGWPELVAGFQPDLVFAIASLPEQSQQRYTADGDWFVAGDPQFAQAHDMAMTQLQELLATADAQLVVANAPTIVEGRWANAELAAPERLAAWNAQLEVWQRQWPQMQIFDWAAAVQAAEQTLGVHRPDGVHYEQDVLDVVVSTYVVDQLLATYELMSNPAAANNP